MLTYFQLLRRPCNLGAYLSTHNRVFILQYWQFLFQYYLSVFAANVDCHINSVFHCLLQVIITWRSRMPQSPCCQPFAEYLFLDTHWEVFFVGQDITLCEGEKCKSHYRPKVPRGFQEVKVPKLRDSAQNGGKFVSLTHRPFLPPGNTPGTHFC